MKFNFKLNLFHTKVVTLQKLFKMPPTNYKFIFHRVFIHFKQTVYINKSLLLFNTLNVWVSFTWDFCSQLLQIWGALLFLSNNSQKPKKSKNFVIYLSVKPVMLWINWIHQFCRIIYSVILHKLTFGKSVIKY